MPGASPRVRKIHEKSTFWSSTIFPGFSQDISKIISRMFTGNIWEMSGAIPGYFRVCLRGKQHEISITYSGNSGNTSRISRTYPRNFQKTFGQFSKKQSMEVSRIFFRRKSGHFQETSREFPGKDPDNLQEISRTCLGLVHDISRKH